jgi:hypothetical protein
MNRLVWLLFVAFTMLSACEKEVQTAQGNLVGTWELRRSGGGMIANRPSTYAPGNGAIYSFAGNTYKRYANGILIDSGTYTLTKEEAVINNEKVEYRIYFSKGSSIKTYINVSSNRLTIYLGEIALDGVQNEYERVEDLN